MMILSIVEQIINRMIMTMTPKLEYSLEELIVKY